MLCDVRGGKRRIYRGGARAVRGAFCRNGICGFGGELALALLVRLLALRIFPFVGGYRVQVRGLENAPSKPSVYAFNHISYLDPLFALAIVPNAAVVVKGKYDSVLAIWILTRLFDFVSIGGGSREDLERAMEKLSRVVGLGRNIVIFPEGTRMRGGRLGDFKAWLSGCRAGSAWTSRPGR